MSNTRFVVSLLIILSSLFFLGMLFIPTTSSSTKHQQPQSAMNLMESSAPSDDERTEKIAQSETTKPKGFSDQSTQTAKLHFTDALEKILQEQQSKIQRINSYYGGLKIAEGVEELFDSSKAGISAKILRKDSTSCDGVVLIPIKKKKFHCEATEANEETIENLVNNISGPDVYDCAFTVSIANLNNKKETESYLKSCGEFLYSSKQNIEFCREFYMVPFDACNIIDSSFRKSDSQQVDNGAEVTINFHMRKLLENCDGVNDKIDTITKFLKQDVSVPSIRVEMSKERNRSMVLFPSDVEDYFWSFNTKSPSSSAIIISPQILFAPWSNMDLTLHRPANGGKNTKNMMRMRTPQEKLDFWTKSFHRKYSEKRFLFFGDSQPRTLYRHLEAVLLPNHTINHAKGFDLSSSTNFLDAGKIYGRYIWDPYLEFFGNYSNEIDRKDETTQTTMKNLFRVSSVDDKNDGPDVVLFSIGPWPGSFGQWSFEKFYLQMCQVDITIAKLMSNNNNNNEKKTKFVWLGPFAWPKPRSKTPGFRITNSRFRLFQKLGNVVFSKREFVKSIDALSWTHCVAKKYHRGDAMHYSSAVLFELLRNILEEILPE